MGGRLEREQIDGTRYYLDTKTDVYYPSVTTILNLREDEGKDEAIKAWKEKHDGEDGNAYHETINEYKKKRGTLIHCAIFESLTDGVLWGEEEQEALNVIEKMGSMKKANDDEYEDAVHKYRRDLMWALDEWTQIASDRGITKENVIDVEFRVKNHKHMYAGTADLLYEDEDGNNVLCDLKTSKRIYPEHKHQLVAYANAQSRPIHKLESIKLHPDGDFVPDWHYRKYGYSQTDVVTDGDWEKPVQEVWDEFVELCELAQEEISQNAD